MKKICITGGIACGKSSVGNVLRELGVRIIDADDVCHELFRRVGPLVDKIAAIFGKKILNPEGGIDRRALGRIIFTDGGKREKLNTIVHPEARRAINGWLRLQAADCGKKNVRRLPGANVAAALVPLAYEAGWENGWDAIICVAAPFSAQIARLVRKGLSEKEAGLRIAAQMPVAEKMNKADYVIFNAGTFAGLRQQAEKVFRSINPDV